jgi:hypothetical protein
MQHSPANKLTGNVLAMNRLFDIAKFTAALATLGLVVSCASAPPTAQNQSLLSASGFKIVVASTDRQKLPTLPAGQVTVVTQTGKNWFVYPDLANNRVYVGTEKEYRAYLKLRAQNNLPDVDPQASYFKQDAAMTATTARYADVLPWEEWPEFGGLGW